MKGKIKNFKQKGWGILQKNKIKFRKCSHTYCACYYEKMASRYTFDFCEWVLTRFACYSQKLLENIKRKVF